MRNLLLFPLDEDGTTIEAAPSRKRRSRRRDTDSSSSARLGPDPATADDPIAPPHLLIRASAGTGKTYQLTSRYLRLLLQGWPPETILATTFTRKAAGEILDRIVLWLAEACRDELKRRALADAVEISDLSLADCQDKLALLTRQLHRLRIYTIDAFFMQVALSFSLELGLTPGWDIIEEGPEHSRLQQAAIAGVLGNESLDDVLVLLHQLAPKGEAKRSFDGVLKDRVRDAYRLFLDSAPGAWERIDVPPPLPGEEVDAIRQDLVHYPAAGKRISQAIKADLDRLCKEDWRGFLLGGTTLVRHVSEGKPKYGNAKIPAELQAIYQRFLPHLRSMILQSTSAQTRATHRFLEKYHGELQQLKTSQRLYSFDQITALLASQPQTAHQAEFSFRMDAGIDHLLLDEFQDTSVAQWKALLPLATRCTSDSRQRSFFCVGDVKQAIYGWRGGSSEIFEVLDRKLPQVQQAALQESRRSSPVVIDAVNQVFAFLPTWEKHLGRAQRAASQWPFVSHTTYHTQRPGYFCVETSDVAATHSKEDQEQQVFQRAAARVQSVAAAAPGRTIGILCRTNAKVGRMMNELQRLGVPASEEGGNSLTDSAAVELILSLLQLADHPTDSVAAFHLASSPWADELRLPWRDTPPATTAAADGSEGEALPRPIPAEVDPRHVAALVRKVRRQLLDDGFGNALQRWMKQLWPHCNRRDARRLTQLVEMGYSYQYQVETPAQLGYQHQRRQSIRPTDFVRFVRETKVADPSNATIRVMTVHQAKGLEFDVVVLPDLLGPFVEGHDAFLHRRPSIDEAIDLVCRYLGRDSGRSFLPDKFMPLFDQWEDQRARDSFCVLYVAMTRAIHALHIILPSGLQMMPGAKGNAAYLIKDTFAAGVKLDPASTLYASGEPNWFDNLEPVACQESPVARKAGVRLAKSPARQRNLEVLTPSQLGEARVIRVQDRVRWTGGEARDYGTLVHLWLSQCVWLEQDPRVFDEERLRALAAPFANQLDISAAIRRFQPLIATEPLAPLLDRQRYLDDLRSAHADLARNVDLEVRREQPIAGREQAAMISGTIDRLVLVKQGDRLLAADIIDYKTEQGGPVDTEAKVNKLTRYEAQMSAYRRVVSSSLRLPSGRVSSRLVMLEG